MVCVRRIIISIKQPAGIDNLCVSFLRNFPLIFLCKKSEISQNLFKFKLILCKELMKKLTESNPANQCCGLS